jgi:hypothetical protein
MLIHLVRRTVEPELLSCLRKYGISFYAFSPRTHFLFSIITHDPEIHLIQLQEAFSLVGTSAKTIKLRQVADLILTEFRAR